MVIRVARQIYTRYLVLYWYVLQIHALSCGLYFGRRNFFSVDPPPLPKPEQNTDQNSYLPRVAIGNEAKTPKNSPAAGPPTPARGGDGFAAILGGGILFVNKCWSLTSTAEFMVLATPASTQPYEYNTRVYHWSAQVQHHSSGKQKK